MVFSLFTVDFVIYMEINMKLKKKSILLVVVSFILVMVAQFGVNWLNNIAQSIDVIVVRMGY